MSARSSGARSRGDAGPGGRGRGPPRGPRRGAPSMSARGSGARSRVDARPGTLGWLPPLVLLVNLAVLGLLMGYSSLNLRPDLSTVRTLQAHTYYQWTIAAAAVAPAVAAIVFLWPVLRWLRWGRMDGAGDAGPDVPVTIALRSGHAPLARAAFSLLAGLIAGAATFFGAEYLCRTHVWPALLVSTRIAGNPRLWRARVSHRLLG